LFPLPYNLTLTLSNGEGRVGEIKNNMENITKDRLDNMSKWTIEDFIFYGDMFGGAFVLGVEFDPENPEIGWSLFQQKLEQAKKEFEQTNEVKGFDIIENINKGVQAQFLKEKQEREN